jgi:glycerol uptake facilitator protein
MSVFVAEIIGTGILTLLGCGCVAQVLLSQSKGSMTGLSSGAGWVVICLGWGFAVAFGVYASAWVSGGHINPAVTIALAVAGWTPWSQVPVYIAGQMIGAFLGGVLAWLAYLPHWEATEDPGLKLAVFSTGPAIRKYGANVVTEAIGTFMLVLGVFFLFDPTASKANPLGALGPLVVGFLVAGIGLSLGGPTGFAINPARDLGPRIAHAILPIPGKGGSDWGYFWVPVVGPIIGGIVAAVVYMAFWPEIPAAM